MCNEDILRKIKKALELAERAGTPAEGQTALARAQELMLKYSVTADDLTDDQAEIVNIFYNAESKRLNKFIKRFAVTLRNHFPIEILITGTATGNKLSIIGRRYDAENFRSVLGATIAQFDRLYFQQYKQYRSDNPGVSRARVAVFKDSYCKGFTDGLDTAFKTNEIEKGLIVVTPTDVTDHVKATSTKTSKLSMGSYGAGYREGVEDGKTAGKVAKSDKKEIEFS